MRWFPDEAGYSAEKVYTYINLPALMSNEDKNIGGSLTLDLRKWWRHVQAKNSSTVEGVSPPTRRRSYGERVTNP